MIIGIVSLEFFFRSILSPASHIPSCIYFRLVNIAISTILRGHPTMSPWYGGVSFRCHPCRLHGISQRAFSSENVLISSKLSDLEVMRTRYILVIVGEDYPGLALDGKRPGSLSNNNELIFDGATSPTLWWLLPSDTISSSSKANTSFGR